MTHFAECKTVGGKLVAVNLTIADGVIAAARVSGDFFLSPESATQATLDAIASALVGSPEDLPVAALAARVRAGIPFGVELLGTTPAAVALAVRRAIDPSETALPPELGRVGSFTAAELDARTKSWAGYAWRVLPEVPLRAALNVALDEVLSDRLGSGEIPPTLRFWGWAEDAVILGRTQSLANEVDAEAARRAGVAVVRRMTGGGAMFVQPGKTITYSAYLPEAAVAGLSIRQSYEVCEAWVIQALRELGVDAHHVPVNDIACSDGKIGGAAQARRRGGVLHHTTIAYDMDPGEMVRVLRIGREKLRDKATASASKRVSPLIRQTGLPRDAIVAHLLRAFRGRFGGTESGLSGDELAAGEALAAAKYGTAAWTAAIE